MFKAIGVSNYEESHIKELAAQAKIMPMVNQGGDSASELSAFEQGRGDRYLKVAEPQKY